VRYDGDWYFPAFKRYPETTFGGEFPLEANYKSPYIRELLAKKDAGAVGADPVQLPEHQLRPARAGPAPPSADNWLGTDDQGRDVLARVIYGFRISVLFALTLTVPARSSASSPAPCRASMAAGSTWPGSASWRSGPACRCCTC
jgi:microcin C transport system permease protein